MNTPTQSTAIALVRHGRYTSRTQLGEVTEYLVTLPSGCRFIVLEWADGTMTAQPEVTYV